MSRQVKFDQQRAGDWGVPPQEVGQYTTGTFTVADGTALFYRTWHASDPQAPVLVLLHGLGAHSGWFVDMGNALCAQGVTVYAVDHRGFGRSGGPRGHVGSGLVYVSDIAAFLDEVRKHVHEAPVSILGHSMGAIFALHVAAADARARVHQVAGMILMNPWIGDRSQVSIGTTARILVNGLRKSPALLHVAGGPEGMTGNIEARAMLNADPLWVRAESASFLYQITRMRLAAMQRATEVRAPALVIQCEADTVVVREASHRCFGALGSADKSWQTYPGFAHDCEFEENREILDNDIAKWLQLRRHL